MGELQWALLVVCVVLVIALYVVSRRSKRVDNERGGAKASPSGRAASGDQMDLLAQRSEGTSFDEYGVGRPRRRGEASETRLPTAAPTTRETDPTSAAPHGSTPSLGALSSPMFSPVSSAVTSPVAPRLIAPMAVPATTPAAVPSAEMSSARKPVALIIAPSEETDIFGPPLHHALIGQGLRFGSGEVYHRMIGGQSVYSVASLIKPGTLIPAQAQGFSTKGLLLVMSLPGPVVPAVALDDLIVTARGLATALRADIFDGRRQRLTDEVASALRAEIEDWARSHKPG